MTAATVGPILAKGRARPAAIVRPPASRGLTTGPAVTPQASLLAATFADQAAVPDHGEADRRPEAWPGVRVAARSAAGLPPGGPGATPIRWVAPSGALVRDSLLDLQRLAGNSAVAAALGHGGDGPQASARPTARAAGRDGAEERAPRAGRGTDSANPLQRINIPGLGDIDIAGYLRRAVSILGPAEGSRDRARSDARKGADDAERVATETVGTGNRSLDAGKSDTETTCDTLFKETLADHGATAAAEKDRTAAAKTKGGQVAEKVKALAPAAEALVDPLAPVTGSTEAAEGTRAVGDAAEHAAGPSGPPAAEAPAGAAPAVTHGPGPPEPGPGPALPGPSHPKSEHVPAAADEGLDHGPGPPAPGPGPPAAGPDQPPLAAPEPGAAVPEAGHLAPAPEAEPALPEQEQGPEPAPEPGPPMPPPVPAPAPSSSPSGAAPGPRAVAPAPGQGAPQGVAPAMPGAQGPADAPSAPGGAGAGPPCALVEALKTVKGYRDQVTKLASGVVARIADTEIPILGMKVGELVTRARKLATALGERVNGIKRTAVAAASKVATGIKRGIADAAKQAKRGFDDAAGCVKQTIGRMKDAVVARWDAAKATVSSTIDRAKKGAAALARAAIGRVQGFLRSNSSILKLLGGTGQRLLQFANEKDPLGDAAAYLEQKRNSAHDLLRKAKDGAIKLATGVADAGVKKAARMYQDAKAVAEGVAKVARTAAPYVAGVVAPQVVFVVGAAKKAAARWGGDIRAGAERVKKAIKGEACEVIGETVGPCIDMYLPKPGNNEKGFAKLTGQADITVPLQELDVPCNVKMGRSASVSVERSTSGYSVAVEGGATIYANLAAGEKGTKTELKVERPMGGMATVWEHLTGAPATPGAGAGAKPGATGAPATGAPATGAPTTTAAPGTAAPTTAPGGPTATPTPGTPAAAPGAGGAPSKPGQPAAGASSIGVSGEVEGGVKGSASLKFYFPLTGKTTCEGAAGVASLLGALGVAASLPSPLDVIARAGVAGSWEGNLVSNTVTLGLGASEQVGLSKEGVGGLQETTQADLYVTAGAERAQPTDPTTMRPIVTVGAELKGEAAGELVVPRLAVAKGSASGSGKVESTLQYDRPTDRIILQSVTAQAELGLAAGGINPAVVASQVAAPFGPMAASRIYSMGLAHSNGSIKATISGKANNLQHYIDAAGTYLGGPVSSVTAAGLVKAIMAVYKASDFSAGVTITATLSNRMGVEGKIEQIGDEGEKAGGSAKASLEVGKQYQLYP